MGENKAPVRCSARSEDETLQRMPHAISGALIQGMNYSEKRYFIECAHRYEYMNSACNSQAIIVEAPIRLI